MWLAIFFVREEYWRAKHRPHCLRGSMIQIRNWQTGRGGWERGRGKVKEECKWGYSGSWDRTQSGGEEKNSRMLRKAAVVVFLHLVCLCGKEPPVAAVEVVAVEVVAGKMLLGVMVRKRGTVGCVGCRRVKPVNVRMERIAILLASRIL